MALDHELTSVITPAPGWCVLGVRVWGFAHWTHSSHWQVVDTGTGASTKHTMTNL